MIDISVNDQKGFTLVELMIVVAIIGILAAIAIPMYSDYVSRTRAAATMIELDAIKQQVILCVHDGAVFTNCNAGTNGIVAINGFTPTPNTLSLTSINAGVISGVSGATSEDGTNLQFVLTPTMPAGAAIVSWKVTGTICNEKRGIKYGC